MTPEQRQRIIEVCDMIATDAEADTLRYDGMPLTGRTVATITGEQNAMIAALARLVKEIAEDKAGVDA